MTETTSKDGDKAVAKKDQLLLGIDFGTSRIAVQSDRGCRDIFMSAVGYPKDIIALKLFNHSHVIGEEALDNHSSLDIYTPMENGTIKEAGKRDLETARLLLKHAVDCAHPLPGDKVCGIIGVPAQASLMNRETLLRIAEGVIDVVLVVSEPFLVAYSINKISNAIVIDIGAGTVDICSLRGALPEVKDQITLIKAGNYLDERLENAIVTRYPDVQITRKLARKIKEKHAFVGNPEDRILVTLRVDGKPGQFDVTEQIQTVCESVVPEIIEQLENLIQHFDPENQEEALKNIYLAGGGSGIKGLDRMLVDKMKDYGEVVVTCVNDADFAGCSGALDMAKDIPPENWHKLGLFRGDT